MKYLVELTETQMDALRKVVREPAQDKPEVRDAYDVMMRAPLVPDDCACALGPISDDLCPVHDADDLGFDDEGDFDPPRKAKAG